MRPSLRILHAESRDGSHGGQTIRLAEEARLLNSRPGVECWVAGQRGGPLDESLEGVPWYIPFVFNSFRLHPAVMLRAIALLRRLRPNVVHTHSSRDAWTFGVAARLLGIPIVRGRHVTRGVRPQMYRNLVYTHLADAFTASGATVGQVLVDGGVARAEQVFITPGGFDPERFNAAHRDPEFLRRELGLPPEVRIVGGAANVRHSKGIDVLVDAFDTVQAQSPAPVHLVLAGNVTDQDKAALSDRSRGAIHFLGFRTDIEDVLGGFDIFVMASRRFDGIPQVIPQAMALRVPVVGTEAGGIPDMVEHGMTGYLVAPEDPAALAAMILKVLAEPPTRLEPILDSAQSRALGGYTFDRVVDTYLEAYAFVT